MKNLQQIQALQQKLEQCTLCPKMFGPAAHGLAVDSKVMLITKLLKQSIGRLGKEFIDDEHSQAAHQ